MVSVLPGRPQHLPTTALVALLFLSLPWTGSGLPSHSSESEVAVWDAPKRSIEVPIVRKRRRQSSGGTGSPGGLSKRSGGTSASAGLGDALDLFYSVALQIGDTDTVFNLDTGSSDLWVITPSCQTPQCLRSPSPLYSPSSLSSSINTTATLSYGDSLTGTSASGPVVADTVVLAGLELEGQWFCAVNWTDSGVVDGEEEGAAGIFGLGFYGESQVQAAVINAEYNYPQQTDEFISTVAQNGPLLSRLAASGALEQPMFTVTLQRDTIDVGGDGALTIGRLPDGVDNSSLTWVPVVPYPVEQGGMGPPSFAPDEVYPLRWEVAIDAVYLDGQKLADSSIEATVQTNAVSALIDTGNSLIRGPSDVVSTILSTVSPTFSANPNSEAFYPCSTPHTLSFEIGGQQFPVDPRDFAVSSEGSTQECWAGNVVMTDPPAFGGTFSWSLGDPFLKSNMVAFYYGNLTHPSVDPPRIGFKSLVPQNASDLLRQAVSSAQDNGAFPSTSHDALAATATALSTTISIGAPSASTSSGLSPSTSGIETQQKSAALRTVVHPMDGLWFTLLASLVLLSSFVGFVLFNAIRRRYKGVSRAFAPEAFWSRRGYRLLVLRDEEV